MSQENALTFIRQVNQDAGLQAKLRPLAANDMTSLLKVAAETGFDFSADDYLAAMQAQSIVPTSELSDDDLNLIAGGGSASGGGGAGKVMPQLGIAVTGACTIGAA